VLAFSTVHVMTAQEFVGRIAEGRAAVEAVA